LIAADVLSSEVEDIVKNIFFAVFPNLSEKEFSWDKEQKDYENWDSFAQLNLITFVESKFDITLSLEESIDIKSAHDLLECVRSHLK
jgi:acyl carrier protein